MRYSRVVLYRAHYLLADQFQREVWQFAGKHVDEHDPAGGYTCTVGINRLAVGQLLTLASSRVKLIRCFQQVFEPSKNVFTAEEWRWMVFDPVMLEHSLYNTMG